MHAFNVVKNMSRKPLLTNKRTLWKISNQQYNVYIRHVGQYGLFYTHNNVGCSLTKFINSDDSVNTASNRVANNFNISIDEKDIKYFIDKMNKDELAKIQVECHVFGNPTNGFFFNPHYLKKILD